MTPNPYDELIAPLEGRMIRTIARLVRDPDEAADAMQEVLTTIWRNLERVRRHPNPQAYMMSICISKAYDALRRRSRTQAREVSLEQVMNVESLMSDAAAGNEDHAEERQALAEGILSAIAELPPQQAQAVLLRLVHDYSYQQIAETLDCAEATAYSHVSKGKARLREIFLKNGSKKEPVQ